jgi:hypothetical protein
MIELLVNQARGKSADGEKVYPSQQQSAAKTILEFGIPKEVLTYTVTVDSESITAAFAKVLGDELGTTERDRLLDLVKEEVKTYTSATMSEAR